MIEGSLPLHPMITKRGDKYQVRVEVGRDANGKRLQAFKTCKTLKEARVAEGKLRGTIHAGEYVQPTKITVSEWLDIYMGDYAPHKLGEKQLERAKGIAENHLKPKLGDQLLMKLTAVGIQQAVSDWKDQFSASTIRQHVSLLRSACQQAVIAGVLVRNPCAGVVLPRLERREVRALTEEEQSAILEALGPLPAYLPTLVALASGLRRGEVLGLRWKDVDLEACSLTVVQTVIEVDGKPMIKTTPKTSHSRRSVLVHPSVLEELEAHREAQQEHAKAIGKYWPDNGLVFRSAGGGPMRPGYVALAWRRVVKELGIDARFHDLRHTHASMLIKSGAPLKLIQDRLGHSSASMTLQVYSHMMPGMEASIVAAVPLPGSKRVAEWSQEASDEPNKRAQKAKKKP